MDKDELINTLENLDLPDIVICSHRENLGKALQDAAYPADFEKGQARVSGLSFLDRLRYQPAWKLAAGLAVCLVIAALAVFLPLVTAPSPDSLAVQIARNDPQIARTLQGEGNIDVLHLKIEGRTAQVVCTRGWGDIVEASIDLDAGKVVSARHLQGLYLPELTEMARAHALDIAMDDPRVKQILDKGGSVGRIFPSFSSLSSASMVGSDMVKIIPDTNLAILQIESQGKSWIIQINLDEMQVENIIEPQLKLPGKNGMSDICF